MPTDPPPPPPFDRLLIVRLSALGDILHGLPCLDTLRAAFPGKRIGWAVRARGAELLQGNPGLDAVHVLSDESPRAILALGRELRRERYDLAIDLQGLFVSGLLARLSGAGRRIGLDGRWEGNHLFLTDAIVPADLPENAVDRGLRFARLLGAERPVIRRQDYLAEAEAEWAQATLADLPRPLLAINVGASCPQRAWTAEAFAGVADRFQDEGGGAVLVGGPGDRERAAATVAAARRPIRSLVGATSVRQLASLIARADLYLGGNTGPTHLAVAVGTPVVGVYGGAWDWERTGPYGRNQITLSRRPPCSPCYRRPTCGGLYPCIREIGPDEALAALRALLARRPVPSGA